MFDSIKLINSIKVKVWFFMMYISRVDKLIKKSIFGNEIRSG